MNLWKYRNPRAAEYVARILGERRDKIARHWFDRIPPLDFFRIRNGLLTFHDLGEERGIYPGPTPRYRIRVGAVDENRKAGRQTEWIDTSETEIEVASGPVREILRYSQESVYPFTAVECQVDRGDGWSRTVTAYFSRKTDKVVAVDRK